MAQVDSALVELFKTKAGVVGAKVTDASSWGEAVAYIMELCEKKEPAELLADAPEAEVGPLNSEGVPTRKGRVVGWHGLAAADGAALEKACAEKGALCVSEGLRNYLAGFDVGVVAADLAVADSGTCILNANDEETRLASMVCEISVIMLRPSTIKKDLASIAGDLRAMQQKGGASCTTFITGPSRTADIERVLTIGVHGPLELHIILLEDK